MRKLKKLIAALVLVLFVGFSGLQAEASDSTLVESNTEVKSIEIVPYASPSRPTLQNPGGGVAIANFNTAVSVGAKTTNHSTSTASSLPTKSSSYSSKDLISGGQVKQRRYYDTEGKAYRDIDYFHSGAETHVFPHYHNWTWSSTTPTRSGWFPAQF